jgi:hypothetical protein
MKGRKKTPKYVKVAALLRQGYQRKTVAYMLDIKLENIGSYTTNARKNGISLTPDGSAALVGHMPEEVGKWLWSQVPEGASLGDAIIAIITDAYHDEMDKQK